MASPTPRLCYGFIYSSVTRSARGSASPLWGGQQTGFLSPPRACAAPQPTGRGRRLQPARSSSQGHPSPSLPHGSPLLRGLWVGAACRRWDARQGGGAEQLQPLRCRAPQDGDGQLSKALPGFAAPLALRAADGTGMVGGSSPRGLQCPHQLCSRCCHLGGLVFQGRIGEDAAVFLPHWCQTCCCSQHIRVTAEAVWGQRGAGPNPGDGFGARGLGRCYQPLPWGDFTPRNQGSVCLQQLCTVCYWWPGRRPQPRSAKDVLDLDSQKKRKGCAGPDPAVNGAHHPQATPSPGRHSRCAVLLQDLSRKDCLEAPSPAELPPTSSKLSSSPSAVGTLKRPTSLSRHASAAGFPLTAANPRAVPKGHKTPTSHSPMEGGEGPFIDVEDISQLLTDVARFADALENLRDVVLRDGECWAGCPPGGHGGGVGLGDHRTPTASPSNPRHRAVRLQG